MMEDWDIPDYITGDARTFVIALDKSLNSYLDIYRKLYSSSLDDVLYAEARLKDALEKLDDYEKIFSLQESIYQNALDQPLRFAIIAICRKIMNGHGISNLKYSAKHYISGFCWKIEKILKELFK
jgi:hypothetical protein